MTKMLPMFLGGLFWAVMTQWSTQGNYRLYKQQSAGNKIAFAMLVITLALPIALRTSYNDTFAYARNFVASKPLSELLAGRPLGLLENPAFLIYNSLVRTYTDNFTFFFLFPAFFVQYSYIRFIRRHCPNFPLGVFLYICLGTYTFVFAAMKQTIAMAILLYAVDFLMDRKLGKFFLTVFFAFLFHTYAIVYLILPFFTTKPWNLKTFALLACILLFANNFEGVIKSFLDIANESGKSISESEIIGTASINPLRVAVYAVTPLFALVFRRYLFYGPEDREHNILINMSIISVSIMSLGLVSGANMFARMAQYFEFGMICSLPWMMKKPFEAQSAQLVNLIAISCFLVYFIYAHVFWMPFDDHFERYTVLEFMETVYRSITFG